MSSHVARTRIRGDSRSSPVKSMALYRKFRFPSVASRCFYEHRSYFRTFRVPSTRLCASVLNLDPRGICFFFLNTLRALEAEHSINYKDRRADTYTHTHTHTHTHTLFRHGSAEELSPRLAVQAICDGRTRVRATDKRGRMKGFIVSSSAR